MTHVVRFFSFTVKNKYLNVLHTLKTILCIFTFYIAQLYHVYNIHLSDNYLQIKLKIFNKI